MQEIFSGVGVAPGRVLGTLRQMPRPVSEPHANVNIPADVTVESQAQRVKDAAKAVQAELRARAAIASGEGQETSLLCREAPAWRDDGFGMPSEPPASTCIRLT